MYKHYFLYSFIASLVLFTIVGCQPGTPEDHTEQMAQRLHKIRDNIDPSANKYANNKRLKYFKSLAEPERAKQNIQYHTSIAQELLYSGRTKKAISRFKEIKKKIKNLKADIPDRYLTYITEMLAISYLRLGEQQNCLNNHTSASCLIPITENGIHSITEGSEKAIEVYKDILNKHPEDMDSRWLLNIAYMTLGKYPEQVPSKWLIPDSAFTSDYDIKKFADVASKAGVAERGLSGGSITEDFNNDGNIDIMASSWGLEDQLQYFENTGDGSFAKKTEEAGLKGITGGLNLVHADFNNDGYMDVFVLRGAWLANSGRHPNSLLKNNGDGTFSDVTKKSGLLSLHPTQTAAWGDYNNDGWVDLYIGNETTRNSYHPAELYRNNGDGTFTDVAEQTGVAAMGFIKGVTWGDYNNDSLQDLYISRLGQTNLLFRNLGKQEGSWRFREVARKAGVQAPVKSFPTWFWDYNNDGYLDIFVSGYYTQVGDIAREYLGKDTDATLPRLYENNGDGTFSNVTEQVHLDKILYSMGSNFGDLDNDGYLDFYVGTGDPDLRSLMPSRMFRNNKGENFQEVTTSGGFGNIQKGHGVSFADLDNDGDQDIYMVMGGALKGDTYPNILFENPGHSNNWITLKLRGKESNSAAIGVRIKVAVQTQDNNTRYIYRVVSSGGSFGASSLQQEIGLGANAESIKYIEITWPTTGKKQKISPLQMNSTYEIIEGTKPVEIQKKNFNL